MTTLLNKWREGLAKTRKTTFGRISNFIGTSEINDQTWDNLEALLIQTDMGMNTTQAVIDSLQKKVLKEGITDSEELLQAIRDELRFRLSPPPPIDFVHTPIIILIVGVNGSGKTTNMAKLGKLFKDQGKRVVFGAGDTFRAAAIDQIQIWGERIDVPVICGQPGGDSGAVAFDTTQAAINRNIDIALIDTAGRLHTRFNLMQELKKVYRVIGKALPGAPHAVWLVMDATTGQNAIHQAEAFKKAVNVTGVILTKLDSSARGGMAFAIQNDLGLPILYAGLGEQASDLQGFDPEAFISGILSDF